MFRFNKGSRSVLVQAGLVIVFAAVLSACGQEPAPVDTAPARLAASSSEDVQKADGAELPVVVVTASRSRKGKI